MGEAHGGEDVGGFGGAGLAGGAEAGGDSFYIESDDERFGVDVGEAQVGGVGDAGGAGCVDGGAGDGGDEGGFEAVAECGEIVAAWFEASHCCASSAARPRATMPGTFSVPARRWRSWGPPWKSGASSTPLRTKRTPVPCGAYILWPERESRSTFLNSPLRFVPPRSMGSLAAACTASVWKSVPWALAMRASLPMGWMAPVSLLASMMESEARVGAECGFEGCGVDDAVGCGREIGDLDAAFFERLGRVEDGVVLDCGGDEVCGFVAVEIRLKDSG